LILSGEDPDNIDDENLAPFSRRPKLVHDIDSTEVSDYVTVRLAVIRAKALRKYREVCYNRDSQGLNT
jgi:hypothetical protein